MADVASVIAGRDAWACYCGDSLAWLKTLPSGVVQCCVTSPPYYGLRDYGTASWVGGDPACDHKRSATMRAGRNEDRHVLGDSLATNAGQLKLAARSACRCGAVREDQQIGLEETPEEYVDKLVAVFAEVRRVLHPTGTLFLNLGDSYAGSGRGEWKNKERPREVYVPDPGTFTRRLPNKVKAKDLIGIPWMTAFSLRESGWYLRSECLWHKPNAMTESMLDRCGRSHETVFMLSKSPRSYFDRLAVPGTQLLRSVWSISVNRYKGAHFATMPAKLAARCVTLGTSERGCCPECGNPWVRIVDRVRTPTRPGKDVKYLPKSDGDTATAETNGWNRPNVVGNRDPQRHVTKHVTTGWRPSCECGHPNSVPCVVLDPFAGSGTTLAVGVELGRRAIGCDLNPEYLELVHRRLSGVTPTLFAATTEGGK